MILMRTLRKDYARYSRDEELDDLVREGGREGGGEREGGKERFTVCTCTMGYIAMTVKN